MSVSIPHLIVEPDDGVGPVRELINSAEKSLLIKQFTFSEPTLLQAVTDRKSAGVRRSGHAESQALGRGSCQ